MKSQEKKQSDAERFALAETSAARGFATSTVHAGRHIDPTTGSVIAPLYQTATFVLPEVGRDLGFDYTRSSNPSRQALEENLAELEGGGLGVRCSSGMAAVDAVLRLYSAGDHIVCSHDVYGGVSRLFDNIASRSGISISYVDTSDPARVADAITPATKLLWVETPTNPLLQLSDIEALSALAKDRGIVLGVDSTFATPFALKPLEYGADIVLHSTTKYISGHNQIIGGACITRSESIYEGLKFIQKTVGAVPSPFDCWLTLTGIKTLSLRMERHSENAAEIARYLEQHPLVSRVAYPGLSSHPQHELAKKQLDAFGGMITFELHGGFESGVTLMNSLKLISLAESLGAVESMITHPASMTHVCVPREERLARGLSDGLVRLSVGIESLEDIKADLEHALEAVRNQQEENEVSSRKEAAA